MTAVTTGAVYDRGYRPYDGVRGGRRAATFALFKASVRRALGIRRSWRQKLFPWVLLGIATIPALINVGVGYVTRDQPLTDFEFFTYREYVGVSSTLLLFVALTAPDLICPDRRHRVLPLIFARPLTGRDYVLAKLGAMVSILFAFSFLPQVVLFVGQMLVSRDGALDYFTENAEVLWQVPTAVFLLALYYGSIGLALSSVTTRRIVAGASFIGLLLLTSIVAAILIGVDERGAGALLNLLGTPLAIRDLVFLGHMDPEESLGGVANAGLYSVGIYTAVIAAALGTLFWRYRYAEA
jgi:ABC-2 type transport system permease protein